MKAPSGDNSVIGVLFVVRKTESEMNTCDETAAVALAVNDRTAVR